MDESEKVATSERFERGAAMLVPGGQLSSLQCAAMTARGTPRIRHAENRPANLEQAREFERLVDEFFRSVSFARGTKPSYGQLYQLFIEGGRLIKNSLESPEISDVTQFIASRQKLVDAGSLTEFLEVEVAEITEWFGSIAHRLSTYDKRGTLNGRAFEGAGVISTQFIHTPAGWRISSMAWDDERLGLVIPDGYRGHGTAG